MKKKRFYATYIGFNLPLASPTTGNKGNLNVFERNSRVY